MLEKSAADRFRHSDRFEHAHIATSIACRRCTYDLRGLPAEGRCPECGLEVWATLRETIDPAASNLPRLRDPIGVGNGLLWFMIAVFLSLLLLALHAVVHRMPNLTHFSYTRIGPVTMNETVLLAGVLVLSGLWSVWRFTSPRGVETEHRVRRDVRLLALSTFTFGSILLFLWHRERLWVEMGMHLTAPDVVAVRSCYHLAIVLAGLIMLHGTNGILQTIGRRSREYRHARGGRQSIGPMTAAVAGFGLGALMRVLGPMDMVPAWMSVFGAVIVWICGFMILIGQAYLVMNAWWIRRALHRPPPRLDDLLALPSDKGPAGRARDEPPHTEYYR